MFSVAARQAREAREQSSGGQTASTGSTLGGLARRVPGAQRPDAMVVTRTPEATEAPVAETTPEDVYSFLSSFQSGVARGRADAGTDDPTIGQEDLG
jgi:hypothetical protein